MTILDDPRLTAYALGELDDAEKAEVEAMIANDPEALAFVEETRALAMQLTSELAGAPTALTPERQAAIDARLRAVEEGSRASSTGTLFFLRRLSFITAIAAVLVVSVSMFWVQRFGGTKGPVDTSELARKGEERRAWSDKEIVGGLVEERAKSAEKRTDSLDASQTVKSKSELKSLSDRDHGDRPSAAYTQIGDHVPVESGSQPAVNLLTTESNDSAVRSVKEELTKQQEKSIPAPFTVAYNDGRGVLDPRQGDASVPNNNGFKLDTIGVGGGKAKAGRSSGLAAEAKPAGPGSPPPGGGGGYQGPGDSVATSADDLARLRAAGYVGGKVKSRDLDAFTDSKKLPAVDSASASHDEEVTLESSRREQRRQYHFSPDDIEKQLRFRQQDRTTAESYEKIIDNPFKRVADDSLSTFSIDVDTASYANVRRFLTNGQLPPRDAVRIEELLNYFPYDDPAPTGKAPFAARMEIAACPWNVKSRLLRIGIKGHVIPQEERKPSNFVFLVDVSGSMAPENKLALVKEGLKLLVNQLTEMDNVAIVTYAGATQVALTSTNAGNRQPILAAIDALHSGGSTNGASGIQLAYEQASRHFLRGGVNRVLLLTDGDFNVGITDRGQLQKLIEEKAKSGVFLSVLGFGMGNTKDDTMEMLADKGNGNYSYIDTLKEARKVLVDQMNSTLVTIAKDVKLQLEFNPAQVLGYRLIGYENRVMQHQDFNNDAKDAGEIGAGHSLTALFEIYPVGTAASVPDAAGITQEPLKYQQQGVTSPVKPTLTDAAKTGEMLTLKIRYKDPEASSSQLLEFAAVDSGLAFSKASDDFRFAAAVASFGMLLRESPYRGSSNFAGVLELGEDAKGKDLMGYRREFLDLVMKAKALAGK